MSLALKHPIFLVTIIGLVIRCILISSIPLFITTDSVHYWCLAMNWRNEFSLQAVLPFRTPVMPIIYGEIFRFFGDNKYTISIFQSCIGLASAAIVTDMTRTFLGSRAAIVAGILASLSPGLLFYENYLMSETLTSFFISLLTWMVLKSEKTLSIKNTFYTGVIAGLLILYRPSMLPMSLTPVIMGVILFLFTNRSLLRYLLVYVGGLALTILPWNLYTYSHLGSFKITATTGWQWWIDQYLFSAFDDSIPSFDLYRTDFKRYVQETPGQTAAWRLRQKIEAEVGNNLIEIDNKFFDFAYSSALKNPQIYLNHIIIGTASFFGLNSYQQIALGEADSYLREALESPIRIAEIRRSAVDRFINGLDAWNVSSRKGIGQEQFEQLKSEDSRDFSSPIIGRALLKIYDIFTYRGWFIFPFSIIGMYLLASHSRYKFTVMFSIWAYIFEAVAHGMILANFDRYSWVFEKILLMYVVIAFALIYQRIKNISLIGS